MIEIIFVSQSDKKFNDCNHFFEWQWKNLMIAILLTSTLLVQY